MLLQAGITLSDGMLMLLDDEADEDGKMVLQSLLEPLETGKPLSSALQQSGYFPRYMVSMAETGEKTGRLSETFAALAAHYDRQERLAISIKNATLYPAILLVMMTAVILILIIYVLPIFNDVFGRLGNRMSPLATGFIQFGRLIGNGATVFAVIFGIGLLIAAVLAVIPTLRKGVSDAIKNKLGGRGLYGDITSSRFVSAVALSLASGLDNEEAVIMASGISGGIQSIDVKNALCIEKLRSGSTLSEAMRDAGIISARDSRMFSLGIRSGMADSAIAEIAKRKDRNTQDRIEGIVARIEPTLVIITSVIVGIILLSVMLPLMGIMTSIG
jgi:type IV pilus assembly protein PilC